MSYRDGRDALQVKVEKLERELEQAHRDLAGRTIEDRAIRLARVEEDLAQTAKLARELTVATAALRVRRSEARRVAEIAEDVALASGFLNLQRHAIAEVRAEIAAEAAARRSSVMRRLVCPLVAALLGATAVGWFMLRTARGSASRPSTSVHAPSNTAEPPISPYGIECVPGETRVYSNGSDGARGTSDDLHDDLTPLEDGRLRGVTK